jgi:hypothetical protein
MRINSGNACCYLVQELYYPVTFQSTEDKIYKTVHLSLMLSWYEMCLVFKDKHKLQVSGNSVQQQAFY